MNNMVSVWHDGLMLAEFKEQDVVQEREWKRFYHIPPILVGISGLTVSGGEEGTPYYALPHEIDLVSWFKKPENVGKWLMALVDVSVNDILVNPDPRVYLREDMNFYLHIDPVEIPERGTSNEHIPVDTD